MKSMMMRMGKRAWKGVDRFLDNLVDSSMPMSKKDSDNYFKQKPEERGE